MAGTEPGGRGAIVGTTASGKSTLALALARRDPGWELVSVDSMQVYRGMDVGTAKPTLAERADVPHHLLDVADPDQDFDLATFQQAVRDAVAGIERRGRRALLVGGTALYLRAVVDDLTLPGRFPSVRAELEAEPDTTALHATLAELDPLGATRMEPTNRRRVVRALEVTLGSGRPFSSFGPGLDQYPPTSYALVGVRRTMEDVDRRIERRVHDQVAAGWVEEVRQLLEPGRPAWSRTAAQALGYEELAGHVQGGVDLDDAVALIVQRTRRFARRQRSWLRRDPRIQWIDVPPEVESDAPDVVAAARALLGRHESPRDAAGRR